MGFRRFAGVILSLLPLMHPFPSTFAQERTEAQVFADIEAFLFKGAVKNFDRVKGIEDLCTWIARYREKYIQGTPATYYHPIDQLLRREFEEINRQKLQILFHLILQCGGLGYGERIVWRTGTALEEDPGEFFRALEKSSNWTTILDKLSENWMGTGKFWEAALAGAAEVQDEDLRERMQDHIRCLRDNSIQRERDIEAFIVDPIAGFERIKGIENICWWLAYHDSRIVHDGVLEKTAWGILFQERLKEVDEKWTEIVIHMITHCGSGLYGELLTDPAESMLRARPDLFIRVLERTRRWKDVVDQLLALADVRDVFLKLGDSEFEKQVKEYVQRHEY